MSAPTEQDRARQIAKDIREEFAMDLMVGTADNLYDNFEDAVYRRFAAALQAERERTRAETWSKAVKVAVSFDHYMARNVAIEMRNRQNKDDEAAQLPQGKDK